MQFYPFFHVYTKKFRKIPCWFKFLPFCSTLIQSLQDAFSAFLQSRQFSRTQRTSPEAGNKGTVTRSTLPNRVQFQVHASALNLRPRQSCRGRASCLFLASTQPTPLTCLRRGTTEMPRSAKNHVPSKRQLSSSSNLQRRDANMAITDVFPS